ncbi:MAG: GNAT family N-acetyltransferase [Chloroflexota bacterium]
MALTLRTGRFDEVAEISNLITSEGMPAIEVDHWIDGFWVLDDGEKLVACAGVEIYGETAMLRSVMVAAWLRGTGEGIRLINRSLDYAREKGAKRCYLFTMTAQAWFPRFGFAECSLDDFEADAREGWQYKAVSEHEEFRKMLVPMRAEL